MPTTTNFGWTTPADTDFVKDGALAIRTLGNGIDTSMVDLKGGTTGQILSKTTNADMDFTWINNDQGDITEVAAGTGISGGGTTGSVTITNSMATAIDAKGDLIVGTGADTFDRLAVGGTNGHVLTVDSATSTGLKWAASSAGGFTLINTGGTTLTGSSTAVSSIPATYKHLFVLINRPLPASDTDIRFRLQADTNARYAYSGASGTVTFTETGITFGGDTDNTANTGQAAIWIYDYANTTTWKSGQAIGFTPNRTTSTSLQITNNFWAYNQTGAIDQINFFPGTGNWTSGTVYVYGVS